jgi:hypothetical protein
VNNSGSENAARGTGGSAGTSAPPNASCRALVWARFEPAQKRMFACSGVTRRGSSRSAANERSGTRSAHGYRTTSTTV